MKHLLRLIRRLLAGSAAVAGLFALSTLPAVAFPNFTTNGGTATNGGGSGSVGTLQQVLDAGNTANTSILLTGSGTLNIDGGIANRNLFLDDGKNASSSPNFIFDGTVPSTGAGMMALGVGAATQTNALFTIDGNNGTNVYGLRLLDQGAGTSGFRYDLSANGDLHIDTSSNIYSGTDFRIGTTNRPLRIQVNSSAFNSGSPYGMDFDVLALPTKVSFQFNGSDGQVADLFNIYNNSASSSPVFAINSQGKTAIGVGASTSTSAMLSVAGTASSTGIVVGEDDIVPYASEVATLGLTGQRFGGLYLDTRPAENAVNIITSSPYEIHFTGSSGADIQSSASTLKLGVASTFSTQFYSNGAEANPQLRLEADGRVTMRPGSASVISAEFNSTSTRFINSSSTFFLSGASALVSDTAPIPTSTSVTVNGIPNQFYAFNATTTNCVYWVPGTLRGAWDATQITPTISWTSASGSGDVVWRLRAQSLADGTNLGSTFTGVASYATGTFSLAYFRDVIPMTALTVQNAAAYVPIRWELCREAGNSGDTFGGDAYAEMVMGKYYATNQSD